MYQAGDESAIVSLFEKVFQHSWSREQWAWRFDQNPAGNHMIALMWDGKTLAGHYAVSPVDLQINNEPVKSALSLTTMTHPDYGGRGVFKELSTHLYNYLEEEKGYQLIWGFPNTNSHYGFIKHLGWKDIIPLHTLAASPNKFSDIGDIEVQTVNGFTLAMAKMLNDKAKEKSVSVIRSKEYLQWRIVDKPATKYDIWIVGAEDDPSAVVITKLYSQDDQYLDLNIIEWAVKDIKQLSPIIASIINQKVVNEDTLRKVTMWYNLFDSSTYGVLEKMGFEPSSPVTYFAGRPSNEIASQVLNFKNWHLSFIDSDVY